MIKFEENMDAIKIYSNEREITKKARKAASLLFSPILNNLGKAIFDEDVDAIRLYSGYGALSELLVLGVTPLSLAASLGSVKSAEELLNLGAKINGPGTGGAEGTIPLHAAISCGMTQMASFLLKNGADPRLSDHKGFEPIHNAVLHGNLRIVRQLHEAGADMNWETEDWYNNSPLEIARLIDDSYMIALLLRLGAKPNPKKTTPEFLKTIESIIEKFEIQTVSGAGFARSAA